MILAKVRSEDKIAVSMTLSGIATTLFPGGKTTHSAFKLPLSLTRDDNPICHIDRGSNAVEILQNCLLILWNECTQKSFKALDKEWSYNIRCFDGWYYIFYYQVTSNKRFQLFPVEQTLMSSTLTWNYPICGTAWECILIETQWLLKIGDGKITKIEDIKFVIPPGFVSIVISPEKRSTMYTNIKKNYMNLIERAILAANNEMVNVINQQLLVGKHFQYCRFIFGGWTGFSIPYLNS